MKPRRIIFGVLLIALVSGCGNFSEPVNSASEGLLRVPYLSEFPKNGIAIDTTGQLESRVYPFVAAQGDTVHFLALEPLMGFGSKDHIVYSKTHNFKVIVDPEQLFASEFDELNSIYDRILILDAEGNEIPRKPTRRKYKMVMKFPVFILNESDSTMIFEHHDGRMVMIQEALTRDGKWKAIEYFQNSGCGNSFAIHTLKPNQLLVCGVNKYQGDFKTKLRVRLISEGQLLFSNTYSGFIHEEQFEEVKPRGYSLNDYLKRDVFIWSPLQPMNDLK